MALTGSETILLIRCKNKLFSGGNPKLKIQDSDKTLCELLEDKLNSPMGIALNVPIGASLKINFPLDAV